MCKETIKPASQPDAETKAAAASCLALQHMQWMSYRPAPTSFLPKLEEQRADDSREVKDRLVILVHNLLESFILPQVV